MFKRSQFILSVFAGTLVLYCAQDAMTPAHDGPVGPVDAFPAPDLDGASPADWLDGHRVSDRGDEGPLDDPRIDGRRTSDLVDGPADVPASDRARDSAEDRASDRVADGSSSELEVVCDCACGDSEADPCATCPPPTAEIVWEGTLSSSSRYSPEFELGDGSTYVIHYSGPGSSSTTVPEYWFSDHAGWVYSGSLNTVQRGLRTVFGNTSGTKSRLAWGSGDEVAITVVRYR